MKLTLHISPCPNDTFMFDALIHHRIDTEGLEFDVHLADIEELNNDALHGRADVTKLSYAVVPEILSNYQLSNSGSALGRGNGPLLVSRHRLKKDELAGKVVAIPGRLTTANRLLETLFPEIGSRVEFLFSDIADAVVRGDVDAGVLIHEGRFTYAEKGLILVADLGQEWELRTGLPLPLGAIAVKRSLPLEIRQKMGRVLRRSIQHAFDHPADSYDFIKAHAQEMSDEVTASHIDLFVNRYSLDLGKEGREAVYRLLEGHIDLGESLFVG